MGIRARDLGAAVMVAALAVSVVQWAPGSAASVPGLDDDVTFGEDGFAELNAVPSILGGLPDDLRVLPDGSIVAVGAPRWIARFDADGVPVAGFGTNGVLTLPAPIADFDLVYPAAIGPDGSATFARYSGPEFGVRFDRYLISGEPDPEFGVNGSVLVTSVARDGFRWRGDERIHSTADGGVALLTKGDNYWLQLVVLSPSGEILLDRSMVNEYSSRLGTIDGSGRFYLLQTCCGTNHTVRRYSSDGVLDSSFQVSYPGGEGDELVALVGGGLAVAAHTYQAGMTLHTFSDTGQPLSSERIINGGNGIGRVEDAARLADGRFYVSYSDYYQGRSVHRFMPDGQRDLSYSVDGQANFQSDTNSYAYPPGSDGRDPLGRRVPGQAFVYAPMAVDSSARVVGLRDGGKLFLQRLAGYAPAASPMQPVTITLTSLLGCEDEPIVAVSACPGGGPDGLAPNGKPRYPGYRFEVTFEGRQTVRRDADRDHEPGQSMWSLACVVCPDPDQPDRGPADTGDLNDRKFYTFSEDYPVGKRFVDINVALFDDDNNADDPIDLNPESNELSVTFVVDRWNGTWELAQPIEDFSVISNPQFVVGGGDTENVAEGGHPALLTLDISTQSSTGDLDNDGLLDGWELYGLTIPDVTLPNEVTSTHMFDTPDNHNLVTLDFPAWGAHPSRPDIFVEADWAQGTIDGREHLPIFNQRYRGFDQDTTMADVIEAFADAPDPIALHVDAGEAGGTQLVANDQGHHLGCSSSFADPPDCGGGNPIVLSPDDDPLCGVGQRFYEVKNANFNSNRRWAFHYSVSVHSPFYDENGYVDADRCSTGGQGEIGGNDFVNHNGNAGTFMHELGHNLGLRHGGDENRNCKPNYLSVMNYSYSVLTYRDSGLQQPILDYSPPRSPIYGGRHDLLRGLDPLDLDETAFDIDDNEFLIRHSTWTSPWFNSTWVPALTEQNQDQAIGYPTISGADDSSPDFNHDPRHDENGIVAPIHRDERRSSCRNNEPGSELSDHDDWSNLRLRFRNDGDSADAAIDLLDVDDDLPTHEQVEEELALLETTDLAVVLSATPDGADTLIQAGVANNGPSDSYGVAVIFSASDAIILTEQEPGTCTSGPLGLTCPTTPNALQNDETAHATVTATVDAGVPGPFTVTAELSSQFNRVQDDLDPANNVATLTLAPAGAPSLYRGRQGELARNEPASRLIIERNVTLAAQELGVSDWDPDNDGWAVVGRSGGAGESGDLANFRIAPDGVPIVSTRHPNKGCVDLVPPNLEPVAKGQTRLLTTVAEDTRTCRTESPESDSDDDGEPDNTQALYRVRTDEAAQRHYIERSVVAWEARGGGSDFDPDADGWAIVGRSNGSGQWGRLVGRQTDSATPLLVIDHLNKGCVALEASSLGTVKNGQTRLLQTSADQGLCSVD